MGKLVPDEVNVAALSGCGQHLRDRRLDALMAVGEDKLRPASPAPSPLAQSGGPESCGLGGTDVYAQDLAPSGTIDADGDDQRDKDDPASLAHTFMDVASIQR